MRITEFFALVTGNPALLVTSLLTLGVILVNGWTDAPNSIATAVSTRSLKPRTAIILAAVFDFLGVLVMTGVNGAVAYTISNMVNFGSSDATGNEQLVALCAALVAIVIWAVAAWYFGIPTSESHALVAGLTGAALAIAGVDGIVFDQWVKVLYGLLLSTVLGFGMGFGISKLTVLICKGMDRRKTGRFFTTAQNVGACCMAFMHGAQDGQKFIGVFLLGITLTSGASAKAPVWLMAVCALVMGLGVSVGGYRIIKAVGMDMVKLEKHQGFSADIAGAGCLLLATLTGIPVSTTHAKTSAIMGVGASVRASAVNWKIVIEMVLTWVLTFPGCGLIGFLMAKLFMLIF